MLTFGLLALVAVGAVFAVLYFTGTIWAKPPYTGTTFAARKERLKLTIVARGSLESANNGDIYCKVRSGTKGSTIATTIKSLVDAGTDVEKDQEVMVLDDSGFQEQLKDKIKDVKSAYAAKVKAEQDLEIQKLNNETDIEKAINAYELAKINLKKNNEGDYIQALKDVEGRIETANSDLADWKDRAAWSARMAKKGLMSKVQADADANRVDASRISLQKLEEEKRVLTDYTKKRDETNLQFSLNEAKRQVTKAKLSADYTVEYLKADSETKKALYDSEVTRQKEIEDQIAKCVIKAPQRGLVVYYIPDQVKGGGGTQQSIVAQGEPVRESQKMLQIPDLTNMLVNVRVPEAFVRHLHSESAGMRLQMATIKVDAFSSTPLVGHVKFVDTVASTADWFAADVKVYKTLVSIDRDKNPGMPPLKPGMSAEVTITADETNEPVLVIPIQSVLGTISAGADRKCYVIGADGQPVMRDIKVGLSNERLVQITSGLEEGDKVVENPKALLDENSDLKAGKPRPTGAKSDMPGGGGSYEKSGTPGGGKVKGGGGPGAAPVPGAKGPGGAKVGWLAPDWLLAPRVAGLQAAMWSPTDAFIAKL